MKISEIVEIGEQVETPVETPVEEAVVSAKERTYDIVYSSDSHRNIHARVWKKLPEGLIKARLSQMRKDKKDGSLYVDIVGTILDGEREIERVIDGENTIATIPKYKTETVTKIIKAKGVVPSLIKLRLVNVDINYKFDHMKKP